MFKLTLRKIVKYNSYDFFYKVLKQKKQKWKSFIILIKKQFKLSKYKRYRLIDQYKIKIKFFSNSENTRRKIYRKRFLYYKKLNYFYSGNNKLKYLLRKNKQVIEFFENRLDFIIFKLKFCLTLKSACNLIKNGYIIVNEKILKLQTYYIQSGDFIQFNLNKNLYQYNLVKSNKWSLIIQNMIINYKTKEVFFLGKKNQKYLHFLPTYLNLLD